VQRVLDDADGWHGEPSDVEEVLAAEAWARAKAGERLGVTGRKED
jgi:1-deoxy-D-xylulose-5-phosphate reductoisomerase